VRLALTLVLTLAGLVVAPALVHAQAEPAPPGYVPPGKSEPEAPPPSPLKWHIAVDARLAVPLQPLSSLPPVGWGAGVQITRALVDIGRLRFGIGFDFAYQRVQREKEVMIPFGPTQQYVSHMTFAGLAVFDGIFGRVRPWLALGPGLSVARYRDPPVTTMDLDVSADAVLPLVEAAFGLGIELAHQIDLGLAGQVDLTFSSQSVGSPPVTPFQPGLFSLRLDVGFRF
jgi:hypothetical protein